VGIAELQAGIDAREFCTIDGVRGRGGGQHNFVACIRGGLGGSRSKGGGASIFGAVRVN
jgi:hypothetical protein